MSDFTISKLVIPGSIESDDAADYLRIQDILNRITEDVLGTTDYSRTAEERLSFAFAPGWIRTEFVAKVGTIPVGWGRYQAIAGDDVTECTIELMVDEAHRGVGIGSALLEQILKLARADGRGEIHAHVLTRENATGPRVDARSGFGSLPATDTGVAYALAHDFALEQVEQTARLMLPVSDEVFEERMAVARAGFGGDYELLHWTGMPAEEDLDDLAALYTEMSTADPHGDIEVTEDAWDADRVREFEALGSGRRPRLTAAARHLPTGRLVAFTTLDVPFEPDRAVNQWPTLVSAAHRGKRLGLAVKLENLRQLMVDHPGHPSMTTINAQDNVHMLAVNESVGFVPVAHSGLFRRILD